MRGRGRSARAAVVLAVLVGTTVGWAGRDPGGRDSISQTDLREWLSYIASDALEGRAAFSEGFALGTDYVARHLQEWGVKPAGDHGTYFQRVAVLGVQADNRSTLTVAIGGQTRTFKQGEGIRLPANVGSKRTVVLDRVEFVGYGLDAPFLNHADYAGKDVTGKAIVWLGSAGPKIGEPGQLRRLLAGRNRYALEDRHAAAVIGPQVFGQRGLEGAPLAGGTPAGARPAEPPGVGAPGRQSEPQPDFTTVQRLDSPIPPSITAQDALFEFLFSQADVKYPELKAMAEKQEPLPSFELKGVKITVDLDATYKVVRTQYTHNVVGIVEGADPSLRSSYVAFGAHADHVGYATGEIADGPNGPRRLGAPGRVKDGAVDDRIWNGADDDGSGTVTLMALARAFALGVRPKRSLLFVWHAGEERGLWGSRYFADYPSVPLGSIVAQFNMDMVGRNRNDNDAEANSVYLVGSDRISTELHNIGIDANASLPKPLRLDFEMNDPSDPEGIYYRSDHYSYAAKGIPIVFYTTGLHPDYHTNKDEVDRINFEKMARIGQLVYETGRRVAELQHPPLRDNKGPRAGKGASGKLPTSGRHSFNGRPNRSAIR